MCNPDRGPVSKVWYVYVTEYSTTIENYVFKEIHG